MERRRKGGIASKEGRMTDKARIAGEEKARKGDRRGDGRIHLFLVVIKEEKQKGH